MAGWRGSNTRMNSGSLCVVGTAPWGTEAHRGAGHGLSCQEVGLSARVLPTEHQGSRSQHAHIQSPN